MTPSPAPIGIAGLGLVGNALAARFPAVLGYDIDDAKRAAFGQAHPGGARDSLAALAADASCVLVAVFDDAQLLAATDALVTAAPRRMALLVSITTALPETLREAGRRCAAAGVALVEAPLSGSSAKIAAGEGRMFVGGDADAITQAAPVLAAITPHRKTIGALGQASAAKLATNLVLGLNRMAIAEGMALAESLGLARADYLALLLDSAATSRAAEEKGPLMAADRFDAPVATVEQHAKDVRLILELGRQTGQALPMSTVHREWLQRSIARGDGKLDNAAVIRALREPGTDG